MQDPTYNAELEEYELQDDAGYWYFGSTASQVRTAALDALRVRGEHDRKQVDADPRTPMQQYADDFAAQTYVTLADARPY